MRIRLRAPRGVALQRYATLLSQPQVLRVFVAAVAGRMVIGMAGLSLILLVRGAGFSYQLAGLAAGMYAAGVALGHPIVGRLTDRIGQTPVLVTTGVTCSLSLALSPLAVSHLPLWTVPALAFTAGASEPPISACLRALWPKLLPLDSDVHEAYALDATSQELSFIAGPLTVAGVATVSPGYAVAGTAALTLVGALWFATAPASRTMQGQRDRTHWAGPLRAKSVRNILFLAFFIAIGIGTIEVGLPAWAEAYGQREWAGALLAVWALGSFVGGLTIGGHFAAKAPSASTSALLGVLALGYFPLLAPQSLAAMSAALIVAGMMIAPTIACLYALLEAGAPRGTTTEAFTWLSSSIAVGLAVGNVAAGSAIGYMKPGRVFVIATLATGIAALLMLGSLERLRGELRSVGEPASGDTPHSST